LTPEGPGWDGHEKKRPPKQVSQDLKGGGDVGERGRRSQILVGGRDQAKKALHRKKNQQSSHMQKKREGRWFAGGVPGKLRGGEKKKPIA